MKQRQSCYFDLFGGTVFSVRSVYGFYFYFPKTTYLLLDVSVNLYIHLCDDRE
jgi:hypothetical protein